jgi:tRNA threonylcarbamoyladenosine biosynthesis protein TsaE
VERWTWRSTSPEETLALGRWLGERAQAGDVFLMEGDLGAGKTLMTKGIALGLGIDPEQVTSPSFTLMQVHHGRLPLYHMDLYRLERAADVEALGLEEFLEGDGVAVVEWAAHLPEGLRPEEGLVVRLDVVDEQVRAVELVARGRRMEGLLGQLAMGEGVQQGPDDEQRKE